MTATDFFNRINVDISSGCWIWIGDTMPNGYGRFRINGKRYLAHRVSLGMFDGISDENKLCCHKCNNPTCVNPGHLYWGDYKSNAADMINSGRGRHFVGEGEENPRSKLTSDIVTSIRKDPGNRRHGYGSKKARELGVGSTAIYNIISGKSWEHVKS